MTEAPDEPKGVGLAHETFVDLRERLSEAIGFNGNINDEIAFAMTKYEAALVHALIGKMMEGVS